MSNETSSTNRPPLKLKGGSGRYRKFSCITYLDEDLLKLRLFQHEKQIRAYAYAYHDKDVREDGTLKEPHIHLLIVTYCTCTLSAIRRWFSGFVKDGKDVTTTAQKMTDEFEMYEYLIHNTLAAKAAGKYQYDKSIRVTNDPIYWQAYEQSNWDNVQLACEMLLKGTSLHDCGRMFGRDFILHYNAIKKYLCDVRLWESEHLKDFDGLIARQDIILLERSSRYEDGRSTRY